MRCVVGSRRRGPKADIALELRTARMACGLFEDAAVAAFEGIKLDNNNEDLKALTKEAVRRGKVEHQKRQQQQQQQEKDR